MIAKPAKLRDGSWGVRVTGAPKAGDDVTVTTASGKTWQAIVDKVIWSGEGVAICSTVDTRKPRSDAE